MGIRYKGYEKFDIAKAFVNKMNNTLPPIASVSGLRTFGHDSGLSSQRTELFYGMSAYNKEKMKQGLSKINPAGGPTPMSAAITAAADDLKSVRGNKAVIIVSDGQDLGEKPILAAKKMLADLGGDVCIYTVLVGDDKMGKTVMDKIAQVSNCGFMVSALDTVPAAPMADYVTEVFFGANAQGLGYHKAVTLMKPLSNIYFDFDAHQLNKQGRDILDKNIEILSKNPDIKLSIEGHASARGPSDYNQKLSEKRAQSVRDYILSKGNFPANRISIVGYGENKPAMAEPDPSRKDSKAAKQNMRVELKVIKY
jgi:OOP family OmpA-OmpF porin